MKRARAAFRGQLRNSPRLAGEGVVLVSVNHVRSGWVAGGPDQQKPRY